MNFYENYFLISNDITASKLTSPTALHLSITDRLQWIKSVGQFNFKIQPFGRIFETNFSKRIPMDSSPDPMQKSNNDDVGVAVSG